MSVSNYLAKKQQDHLNGVATFTAPSNTYLALFSSNPDYDGSGTELTGNGYARQSVAFGATTLATRRCANTGQVTFSASGGDWVEATHIATFDALSGGNLLRFGELNSAFTLTDGNDRVYKIDDLELGLN